jgi:helicase associated protein
VPCRREFSYFSRTSVGLPMTDPSDHDVRGRVSRLEHAIGHLSPAAAEAEAVEFERGLRAIRDFAAGHGGTAVPHGYVDESGFPLAVWVATQREEHLEQRLEGRRRAALERVPGWEWEPEHRGGGGVERW